MSCRLEFDALNELYAEMGDDTVLVSVVVNSEKDEVKAMIQEEGLKYPVFTSRDPLSDVYRLSMLPTTYVINAEGKIVANSVGYSPGWNLKRLLESSK